MTMLPRMPSMRLDGKRALVTGGGRGLGIACAAALAQAGAHVTLLARTAAETAAVADAIVAEGGSADTLTGDVCDVAAVAAMHSPGASRSTSWSTMRGPTGRGPFWR